MVTDEQDDDGNGVVARSGRLFLLLLCAKKLRSQEKGVCWRLGPLSQRARVLSCKVTSCQTSNTHTGTRVAFAFWRVCCSRFSSWLPALARENSAQQSAAQPPNSPEWSKRRPVQHFFIFSGVKRESCNLRARFAEHHTLRDATFLVRESYVRSSSFTQTYVFQTDPW